MVGFAAAVVAVDAVAAAVAAVAVDAVVAVEDMSVSSPANQLQTGGQLIADFGQLLARLLQSLAEFLRENTANKRRSKSGHSSRK